MTHLNLSSLDRGRGLARTLRSELAAAGLVLGPDECMDLVARMHGFRGWDDLVELNDPSAPHPFDRDCDERERERRQTLRERVLVSAGVGLADARRILEGFRPTAAPDEDGEEPGPFGAMAGRMSLIGWDVFPEDPDAPGVRLAGWEPGVPMAEAPDGVRAANVGIRLGRVPDGVLAVRFEGNEDANLEGMDLARSVLGDTPFVLVGPMRRVTMLYRKAGPPHAGETLADGRCVVMGEGGTMTAYGTLPGPGTGGSGSARIPSRRAPARRR